ncbi:hypothetical protein [uncultured Mediterranean phage uvDeep-CGR2-AD12-C183]|nr:hypothetical protein [uncultured Mediterranean phage uvDeep-CGR2-AD12-C183]
MGIVNYTYNRSTSGGEIITHLINSTDGQGLDFANGALLQLAYAAGGVFGTGDFSIEFIIDQSSANSNNKILYTSGGSNEFQITSETGSSKIELTFDSTDYDFSYDMSADYGSPVHYVMTFDRSALATLYKDGNSVATVDTSGSSGVNLDSSGTAAGYLGGVSDYGVTGVFYRWRTWKKLLSAAEVTACYENASVPIADQWTNCVTDLDFAFANPEMSLEIQSRSGAGDGTASAGISQITPIEQLNSKSARIGTTAATPADGDLLVSGNMGVGATPGSELTFGAAAAFIGTDADTKRLIIGGGSAWNNTNGAYIQLHGDEFSGALGDLILSTTTAANAQMRFFNGSAETMTLEGGNVGIGCTPTYELDLANTAGEADFRISSNLQSRVILTDTGGTSGAQNWDVKVSADNFQIRNLADDYGSILNTPITCDSNGKVGIAGIPAAPLHCYGDGGMRLQRGTDDSTFNIANTADEWVVSASYGSTGSYDPIVFKTSDVTRLTISSAGLSSFAPATNTAGINVTTAGDPAYGVKIDSAGAGITNPSLWVYNNGASTGPLAFLESDHTSGTGDVLKIQNDGSGRSIYVEGGGIVEKGGVLRSNLLTNSSFGVWSNSTLENVTGSNIVSSIGWGNYGGYYGTFTDNGTDITSAIAASGTAYARTDAGVSLTAGKLYKIVATVTRTSGASPQIFLDSAGDTAAPNDFRETLADGANTICFEYSGDNGDYLWLQTDGATNYSCTFVVTEVTPGCIAADNLAFDGWVKDVSLDLHRQHNDGGTNTKDGSFYSLKCTPSVADEWLKWPVAAMQTQADFTQRFAGRNVTFGAWVKTSTATHVRLMLYDGDYDTSGYHTGGGAWEWIEISGTISASAAVFDARFELKQSSGVAYISQPTLCWGSAIGEGNYSAPSGEVIWFEKQVDSNKYEGLTGQSDEAMTTLNLEADSNGAIPKGAKSVMLYTFIKDSGSASSDAYLRTRVDSTAGNFYVNDATGKANDAQSRLGGWQSCDSSGDIQVQMEATGSGTLDIDGFEYKGVQLR